MKSVKIYVGGFSQSTIRTINLRHMGKGINDFKARDDNGRMFVVYYFATPAADKERNKLISTEIIIEKFDTFLNEWH